MLYFVKSRSPSMSMDQSCKDHCRVQLPSTRGIVVCSGGKVISMHNLDFFWASEHIPWVCETNQTLIQ